MKNITLATLICGVTLLASCRSTSHSGQIGDVGAPGLSAAQYRIAGNVQGEGSSFGLSPGILGVLLAGPSTIARAKDDAVGEAIYNNDDIDMVIAPKTKVDYVNLFIFDLATVTIKGKGVEVTGTY